MNMFDIISLYLTNLYGEVDSSMTNYYHIVMGDSAKGCLKWSLNQNIKSEYYGKVKNFNDDLSIGSIYELENNIQKRVDWFKKILNETASLYFADDESIERNIRQAYGFEPDILEKSKIIIWHGDNVVEQTALRYLVSRLQEYELMEVSVSNVIEREYEGKKYRARATAECRPEDLGEALNSVSIIEGERKRNIIAEWNELRSSRANLRILENDKVICVDESYYDGLILECTPNDFAKAARVIGTVLGTTEQVVGDTFIDFRLRKLIEAEQIEYRGKLVTMRDFDVKIKS